MNEKADIFSRLFGDSLITPIRDHMAICNETAQTLTPFFRSVANGDFDTAHESHVLICERENQADKLKKEIRLHLPTGFLMSVGRNDLLELVRAQDKIANAVRDLAGLVCGRKIQLPGGLQDDFLTCVETSLATVSALSETVHNLDTLVGTGFIRSRHDAIESGVNKVDDYERLSDDCEHALREKLYQVEHDIAPIEVMFLYKVIDQIGDVADRAQAVANRIRIIIAN